MTENCIQFLRNQLKRKEKQAIMSFGISFPEPKPKKYQQLFGFTEY